MSARVRWLCVAAWLAAGCGGWRDPPFDGGTDADTDPPPCLRAAWWDKPPPDLAACGVCLEAHSRYVSPYSHYGSARLRAVAVPEGLLIASLNVGPNLVLVTTDGQVRGLEENPYEGPPPYADGWQLLGVYAVPVPGGGQTWMVSVQTEDRTRDRYGLRSDLVLYAYAADDGFRRLAGIRGGGLFGAGALPTGELIGTAHDRLYEPHVAARYRPLPDGSVEELRRDAPELEARTSWWESVWPLSDGTMAIQTFGWTDDAERDGERFRHHETALLRVTAELELAAPTVRLTPPFDDPTYDVGQAPIRVYEAQAAPSGIARLVLAGARAGEDAAPRSQLWLQHIQPDGALRWPVPGVLVNPDSYLRTAELGHLGLLSGYATPIDVDADIVLWNEGVQGGPELVESAQIIDRAGDRLLPAPRVDPDGVELYGSWASDAEGNAYRLSLEHLVDGRWEEAINVMRFGPTVEPAWPAPVFVQTCPERHGRGDVEIVGAHDRGAWVVWEDVVPETTGRLIVMLKVALILPDGSFAW